MRELREAFTVIEILIVVLLVAILAATIVPRFISAGEDARESVLQTNLQLLRRQIEIYRAAHNGQGPELDEDGELDTDRFIERLTGRTDENGKLDPHGKCGPYIREWEPNPYTKNQDTSSQITFGSGAAPPRDGSSGWYYSTTTGTLNPNSSSGGESLEVYGGSTRPPVTPPPAAPPASRPPASPKP